MEHSFGIRLGYARWLKHLRDGWAPGHAEIGKAVGRTGQAVRGWAQLDDAPTDYRIHEPLVEFLGIDETWLIRGDGDAPKPDLWKEWTRARKIQLRAAPKGAFPKLTRAKKAAEEGRG